MRIPTITFLLLAINLPALAHHDRCEHAYHHAWQHRRTVMEGGGVTFAAARPLAPPWALRSRTMSDGWYESSRAVILAPPPPPIRVSPHVRIWIGF